MSLHASYLPIQVLKTSLVETDNENLRQAEMFKNRHRSKNIRVTKLSFSKWVHHFDRRRGWLLLYFLICLFKHFSLSQIFVISLYFAVFCDFYWNLSRNCRPPVALWISEEALLGDKMLMELYFHTLWVCNWQHLLHVKYYSDMRWSHGSEICVKYFLLLPHQRKLRQTIEI